MTPNGNLGWYAVQVGAEYLLRGFIPRQGREQMELDTPEPQRESEIPADLAGPGAPPMGAFPGIFFHLESRTHNHL